MLEDADLKELYGCEIRNGRDIPDWLFVKQGCEDFPHIATRVQKKIKKMKNKPKEKKHIFITIQDKQRRLCDIEKLKLFVKRIAYMYDAGFWVIETGSTDQFNGLDFNVHIHLLVKIKTNIKNHKKTCKIKWEHLFGTDLYESDYWCVKQHRDSPDMCSYEDWFEEKLNYFDNTKKGDHENSIDLNLKGQFH